MFLPSLLKSPMYFFCLIKVVFLAATGNERNLINYCEFAIHYLFYSCLLSSLCHRLSISEVVHFLLGWYSVIYTSCSCCVHQQATVEEIMNGEFAVIDHISLVLPVAARKTTFEATCSVFNRNY